MSKRYHVFISHSWTHKDRFEGLKKLLDKDHTFSYSDYSVPKDDPIHDAGTDSELLAAIKNKMSHASVVIVLAGVYATYSKWIKKEIKLAEDGFLFAKPIVAVKHHQADRVSTVVRKAADELVPWRSDSIINAIRRLA